MRATNPSAFVDTSMLYAALVSAAGASREILRAAFQGTCLLFFSTLVFTEVERNVRAKAPEALPYLATLRQSPIVNLVEPTAPLLQQASQIVVAKDAPIVAAAAQVHADYLVTFDRVHLLRRKEEIKRSFGNRRRAPRGASGGAAPGCLRTMEQAALAHAGQRPYGPPRTRAQCQSTSSATSRSSNVLKGVRVWRVGKVARADTPNRPSSSPGCPAAYGLVTLSAGQDDDGQAGGSQATRLVSYVARPKSLSG